MTNLKLQRVIRNLTQQQLGDLVGISGSYIGMLETEVEKLGSRTADKLAKVLNVDATELLSKVEIQVSKYDN